MFGLRLFNIVVVGSGFSVEKVELDDFQTPAGVPAPRLRLPVVVQAGIGEYGLEVTPDRFQMSAESPKAAQHRMGAIQESTRTLVDNYASRKGLAAVGHNFIGSFPSPTADARTFLERTAWTPSLGAALGEGTWPLRVVCASSASSWRTDQA